MLLFWEAIQRESSFFEVRFNRALQYLAKRAGRNIRGGMQRGKSSVPLLRIGSKESDEDADARDLLLSTSLDNVDE